MNDIKNSDAINAALNEKSRLGGCVYLPAGEYTITSPVLIDSPSLGLKGEIWAYNLDPNGVFETHFGTKLKLSGRSHSALSIGSRGIAAGCVVSDMGLQGVVTGMDTRGLFDPKHPYASAGLYFGGERIDQGDFSKISCCGLAVGISIAENSEIDACDFRKINVDGCCMGIYFVPRASYHTHFNRCIVADNPSYGFYGDGRGATMHNLDITNTDFVRNCGANHLEGEDCAAVLLKGFSSCTFRDNLVDSPGTFWYFEPTATDNADKTVYKSPAIGLHLIGDGNRLMGNIFSNSSRESMLIEGKGNILMNNICDGDVIIRGSENTVNGLCFTTPSARLILKGAPASNVVLGVEESRIVRIAE